VLKDLFLEEETNSNFLFLTFATIFNICYLDYVKLQKGMKINVNLKGVHGAKSLMVVCEVYNSNVSMSEPGDCIVIEF
jgi:hypothetical protein